MLPAKFRVNWPFVLGKELKEKLIFKIIVDFNFG